MVAKTAVAGLRLAAKVAHVVLARVAQGVLGQFGLGSEDHGTVLAFELLLLLDDWQDFRDEDLDFPSGNMIRDEIFFFLASRIY